jgi:O-antigen/teichoic acid export membrane protein
MVSITLSSLSILGIVILGGSLTAIFLAQLLFTAIFAVVTVYQAKKVLPQATLHLGWNKLEIRHCYRFGLGTFINGLASTALSSLDRLIIPFYAGPSNLTYYSLPGNVTNRIPGISNTLSATMFPMTSQLDGAKNAAQIETLYVRSFRLITIVAAAVTVTAIAFAHQILLYWLNADFASRSTDILIILAFTNFILALFGPLSNFLLGLGKLKFLTTMSVIMGVLNALLLLLLLPKYGITGAAWAYLISVAPVLYVFYYTEKKYLMLSNRGRYYAKKITGTLITSGIVWAVDVYLLSFLIVNLGTLLIIAAISGILYLLIYKHLAFFEPEDWHDIERFFFQLVRKLIKI